MLCKVNYSSFEKTKQNKKTIKRSKKKEEKGRTHPPPNNKTSEHLEHITGKEQFSVKAQDMRTLYRRLNAGYLKNN